MTSAIKEMPLWRWILLLIAGLLLSALMYSVAMSIPYFFSGWLLWILSFVLAAAMLGLYALFAHWFENRWPLDLSLRKLAPHTGLGFAVGLVFFCVVVGIMLLVDVYEVDGAGANPAYVLDACALFLIVAIGEEVMFRGVLFRWIDERWGFWWAIGVSALIFGFIHITNDNAGIWSSIAIALEAGVLLGAAYKWSGTLWFPIGIHWAWNFAQGNIFGLAVSGSEAGVSVLHPSIDGPDWLTGGSFGPEASVIAAVAGTALGIYFVWEIVKKKQYGNL